MKGIELFDAKPVLYCKLNQGIFKDKFYFGKTVFVDSQKTDTVVLSDRDVWADYSSIKKLSGKNRVPIGENELFLNGFHYKQNLVEMFPVWGNEGVKTFLGGVTVSGKQLFEEIRGKLEHFIDVEDKRVLDLVAIYIISTYCFTIFNSIGYLFFYADKETGKTKFMQLIGLICFNPINATNPSESALFRLCDCAQPTLLIDDYEKIEDDKRVVINQILKVGYKKGGQTIRCEKINDRFEPQQFDVYCPKVITNTSGLDSITLSRCIVLRLLKTKTEKGRLEPDESNPCWQGLRDSCYNFVLENWAKIRENYQNCKLEDFNNRQFELVKGLLAVAQTIEPTIAESLIGFLKASFEDRDLQDITNDWGFILFSSMLKTVEKPRFYAVSEVSVWCRENIGMNSEAALVRWIGKTLSKIPLFQKRRVGSGVEYFLNKELVQDYMERTGYPIDTTQTTLTTLKFNNDEIQEMTESIYDICTFCKQNTLVKYTSVKAIGRNYCEECITKAPEKLAYYV